MGVERQVYEFVMGAKDQGIGALTSRVEKSLDKIRGRIDEVTEAVKAGNPAPKNGLLGQLFGIAPLTTLTLAARGVGLVGKGVASLDMVISSSIRPWMEHNEQMIQFRRETGMTKLEMQAMSTSLLSTTARYGAELSRVYDIVKLVGTGSTAAKKNLAEVSAKLGYMSYTMGITADQAGQLGRLVTTEWSDVFEESVVQVVRGFSAVARTGNMTNDTLISQFMQVKDSMNELEVEQRRRLIPSYLDFIAAVNRSTGRVDDASSVLQKLTQSGSVTQATFQSLGYDLQSFINTLGQQAQGVTRNSRAFQALAETYGLTTNELDSLIKSQKELGLAKQAYTSAVMQDEKSILDAIRKETTASERLGMMWNSATAHMSGNIQKIVNHWEPSIASFIDRINSGFDTWTDMLTGKRSLVNGIGSAFGELFSNIGRSWTAELADIVGAHKMVAAMHEQMSPSWIRSKIDAKRIDDQTLANATQTLASTQRQFLRLKQSGLTEVELRRWVGEQAIFRDPRLQHMIRGGPIGPEYLDSLRGGTTAEKGEAKSTAANTKTMAEILNNMLKLMQQQAAGLSDRLFSRPAGAGAEASDPLASLTGSGLLR